MAIVRLETPGGLDSSMREIVQRTLATDLPIVVYVSPDGARAASAGDAVDQGRLAAQLHRQQTVVTWRAHRSLESAFEAADRP